MKNALLFVFLCLVSCASRKEITTDLPYEIETIYYQNWIGGQEQSGSGTHFHVFFKKPLPENCTLAKVYYLDRESFFESESTTHFVAYYFAPKKDLILDGESQNEYGNKAPILTEPKYKLNPGEVILEFHEGTTVRLYKVNNVGEKELVAYPQARPRN